MKKFFKGDKHKLYPKDTNTKPHPKKMKVLEFFPNEHNFLKTDNSVDLNNDQVLNYIVIITEFFIILFLFKRLTRIDFSLKDMRNSFASHTHYEKSMHKCLIKSQKELIELVKTLQALQEERGEQLEPFPKRQKYSFNQESNSDITFGQNLDEIVDNADNRWLG